MALRQDGELFVDRGDMRAHWSFFDADLLPKRLESWPDEMLWILRNAKVISGNPGTVASLQRRFATYPDEIASRKLKWLVGGYRALLSSFPKAGESKPMMSIVVRGKLVECLCKICCIGHRRPFPYTKWLVRAARETDLGANVLPWVERSMEAMKHTPFLPVDLLSPEWPTRPRSW